MKINPLLHLKIARQFQKLMAELCPSCKRDVIRVVQSNVRHGKIDTKSSVDKMHEVVCNECKQRVAQRTHEMIEELKGDKDG